MIDRYVHVVNVTIIILLVSILLCISVLYNDKAFDDEEGDNIMEDTDGRPYHAADDEYDDEEMDL